MEYGYVPKTAPFEHQASAFARSAKKRVFALFMEPGTGKTKIIIDTTALLYQKKVITGLLVTAPNDVDEQWILQEIPKHLPDRIRYRAACWESSSVKSCRIATELATHPEAGRLAILAINHEAFATTRGRKVVQQFLKTYQTLFCIDEAHAIKTPRAARTRWTRILGQLAVVRRILTGTPITKNPFDLFAQFRWLDERIIGFDSFLAFKHRYAGWTQEYVQRFDKKTQKNILQPYETLTGFQNLPELYSRIDPYVFRQMKADCLDLPPKLYSIIPVPLSPAQLKLYKQIREAGIVLLQRAEAGEPVETLSLATFQEVGEQGITEEETELLARLQDPKGRLTAQIKLVTLLRCRQIAGGFIVTDDRETLCIDGTPDKCPRMRAALTWLDTALQGSGKIIIWARFTAELQALAALIGKDHECVLIHGPTGKSARREGIARFKDIKDPLRILIAHEQSMGVGMDFWMCENMLFYDSSYSFYQRDQAENRAHRIGQKGTVSITDLHAWDVGIDRTMAQARQQAEMFKNEFMRWNHNDLKERL